MEYLLISFLFAILFAVLDGSYSSFAANVLIIVLGAISIQGVKKKWHQESYKLFAIVYVIYIAIGFVFSRSFLSGNFYYVLDSVTYLESYLNNYDCKLDLDRLIMYYTQSEGKDILYHELLHFYSSYGNTFLGGATVYYITLLQTLFGVLSSLTLYKILLDKFGKKAFQYTIGFSVCSFFLLYSSFVIRDIVIAYFFLVALRILLNDFRIRNVFLLFLLAIITTGIRLQSGLFYVVFIIIYIYIGLHNTRYKTFVSIMLIVGTLLFIMTMMSSIYYEETLEVLEKRQEGTAMRVAQNEGFYSYFLKLPVGIRQIALLFYSQLCPFPPYNYLFRASSFSQFVIGLTVVINTFYWVAISYSLISFLFIKKVVRQLTINEIALLAIAAIYIIALTAQPDIRRMIPVYPIIYLLYLKGTTLIPKKTVNNTRSMIYAVYVALLLVYVVIK